MRESTVRAKVANSTMPTLLQGKSASSLRRRASMAAKRAQESVPHGSLDASAQHRQVTWDYINCSQARQQVVRQLDVTLAEAQWINTFTKQICGIVGYPSYLNP